MRLADSTKKTEAFQKLFYEPCCPDQVCGTTVSTNCGCTETEPPVEVEKGTLVLTPLEGETATFSEGVASSKTLVYKIEGTCTKTPVAVDPLLSSLPGGVTHNLPQSISAGTAGGTVSITFTYDGSPGTGTYTLQVQASATECTSSPVYTVTVIIA